MRTRKWVALGATLALMLAFTVASGEDRTPCREAYLASHFTEQQMSFGEFRELYGDDVCATSGTIKHEAGAEQVTVERTAGFERRELP